jgi:tripartite-type tricarboxylate transporter receptor subunit TctC
MAHWVVSLVCACALLLAGNSACSQDYPSRPLRIVVPFAAGGATDVLARLVAAPLSVRLGQPVMVENKAGANGVIGTEAVAKSAPDGYTLLMGTIATHGFQPTLLKNLPYDPVKDFVPVIQVASQVYVVAAHPSFPPNNMRELVALAKQQPGMINYASAARGTGGHVFVEQFTAMAGIDLVPVHYKGASQSMNDVLGGHVPITFDVLLTTESFIKAGKLKALAVTGAQRSPVLPQVPTVAESGFPGYNAVGWNGLFVPAGTPAAMVVKLNGVVAAILADPAVREKILFQGAEVKGGSAAQFGAFMHAEIARWARVIKQQNINSE